MKNYKIYLIDRSIENGKFCTNIRYSTYHKKNLEKIFNVNSLEIISRDEFYGNTWFDPSYNYLMWAEYKYSALASCSECERYEDFITNNDSEYIWILVIWIKLKKENIGMT